MLVKLRFTMKILPKERESWTSNKSLEGFDVHVCMYLNTFIILVSWKLKSDHLMARFFTWILRSNSRSLYELTQSILTTTFWRRYIYYSHFVRKLSHRKVTRRNQNISDFFANEKTLVSSGFLPQLENVQKILKTQLLRWFKCLQSPILI